MHWVVGGTSLNSGKCKARDLMDEWIDVAADGFTGNASSSRRNGY